MIHFFHPNPPPGAFEPHETYQPSLCTWSGLAPTTLEISISCARECLSIAVAFAAADYGLDALSRLDHRGGLDAWSAVPALDATACVWTTTRPSIE